MLDGKYKADSFLEDETINYYFQVLYRDADKEYLVSDHGYQVYLADCIDGSKLMQKYMNEYHSGPKTIEGSASETIARNFEVIDEDTVSLIAPYGLGKEIIMKLNSKDGGRQLKELLKMAQPYLVGVYRTKLKDLIDKGAIISLGDEYQENNVFAIRDDYYDEGIGLVEEPTISNFVSF